MCGILFTNNSAHSKKRFLDALELMKHRGPDFAGGYWEKEKTKLGHNRLSIIDLDKRSNQPFFSTNRRYICVYNGEIYNYRELKKKFRLELHTESDTEVLIELYVRFGPRMLDSLNGMFSIVIFDTETEEVFIARDRLGIKPLYIYQRGDEITVSSEIAPLIELTGANRIDEIGLRQYRKMRTFFGNRTLYSDIQMFPAGHYKLGDRLERYWKLPEGPQEDPDDEEIETLLQSAVDYRCISDVPVGSYLSGGIDSTILAALSSKPDTWTVGFEDNNEFDWAKMAALHINTTHTAVPIAMDEFLSIAAHMINKRKEPLSVPNEVLLYKMTRAVKTRNTVVLSGEGADELFFGYDRIFRWAASSCWNIEEFDRHYSYGSNRDTEIIEEAMSPYMHFGTTIERVATFFQIEHLHGLLRRLDNSTMLCSVEARVPFVDHRLIERMAGVSFDYRMKDGVVKAPLKRIFRHLLPPAISERKKVGFPVPLDRLPFHTSVPGATAMDKWLEFNIRTLFDDAATLDELLPQ